MAKKVFEADYVIDLNKTLSALRKAKNEASQFDDIMSSIGDRGNLNNLIKHFSNLDDKISELAGSTNKLMSALGSGVQGGFLKSMDESFKQMSEISKLTQTVVSGIANIDLASTNASKDIFNYAKQLNQLFDNIGLDKKIDLDSLVGQGVEQQFKTLLSATQNLNNKIKISLGNVGKLINGNEQLSKVQRGRIKEIEKENEELIKQKELLEAAADQSKKIKKGETPKFFKELEINESSVRKMMEDFDSIAAKIKAMDASSKDYYGTLLQLAVASNKVKYAFSVVDKNEDLTSQFTKSGLYDKLSTSGNTNGLVGRGIRNLNRDIDHNYFNIKNLEEGEEEISLYERIKQKIEECIQKRKEYNNAVSDNDIDESALSLEKSLKSLIKTSGAKMSSMDLNNILDDMGKPGIDEDYISKRFMDLLGIKIPEAADKAKESIQKVVEVAKEVPAVEQNTSKLKEEVQTPVIQNTKKSDILPNSEGLKKGLFASDDQKAQIQKLMVEYNAILELLKTANKQPKEIVSALKERANAIREVVKDVTPIDTTVDKLLQKTYGIAQGTINKYQNSKETSKLKLSDVERKGVTDESREKAVDIIYKQIAGEQILIQKEKEEKAVIDSKNNALKNSSDIMEKIIAEESKAEKFLYVDTNGGTSSDFVTGSAQGITKKQRDGLLEQFGGAQKFNATLHTHPEQIAAPSGNDGDLEIFFKDFDKFKKNFILAGEQLAEIDFSSLTREQVEKIKDTFISKESDIDPIDFDNLLMKDLSTSSLDISKELQDWMKSNLFNLIPDEIKSNIGNEKIINEAITSYIEKVCLFIKNGDVGSLSHENFMDALDNMAIDTLSSYPENVKKGLRSNLSGSTSDAFDEISGVKRTLSNKFQQALQDAFIESINEIGLDSSKIFKLYNTKDFDFKTFKPKAPSSKEESTNNFESDNKQGEELHRKAAAAIKEEIKATKDNINATEENKNTIAKEISSYEELCEVVERYNQLVLKSHTEGKSLSESESKELSEINDRFAATKGVLNNPDKYVDHAIATDRLSGLLGQYDVNSLSQYLGIKIPENEQKAKIALEEFKALQDEILGKAAFAEGGSMDGEAIGKYTERIGSAKAKLEELAKQGLLTAEQVKEANTIYETTIRDLESKTKLNNDHYKFLEDNNYGNYESGYDKGYNDAYNNARADVDSEIESLKEQLNSARQELSRKQTNSPNAIATENQMSTEAQSIEALSSEVNGVTEAVNKKTEAFEKELEVVQSTIPKEIDELNKLKNTVDSVTIAVQEKSEALAQVQYPIQNVQKTDSENSLSLIENKSQDQKSTSNNFNRMSNVLAERIKTAYTSLAKYGTEIQKDGRATEEFNEKIVALSESLSKIATSEGLTIWNQQFQQLKNSMPAGKNFVSPDLISQRQQLADIKSSLNSDYRKLNIDPLNVQDGLRGIKAQYDELIVKLNSYSKESKILSQEEIESLEQEALAIKNVAKEYLKVNNVKKSKNNAVFGESTLANAKGKYQHLVQQASQLDNSEIVNIAIQNYTNALNTLEAKQKEFANAENMSDEVLSQKKSNFKQASLECNSYAVALDKIIKKSAAFNSQALNIFSVSEGSDLKTINGRKQALNDYVDSVYGASVVSKEFKASTNEMFFSIKNGDGTITEMSAKFNAAQNSIGSFEKRIKKTSSFIGGIFNGLKGQFQTLIKYYTGSMLIWRAISMVREGFNDVKEIDAALTELKKVTDETDKTYQNFLNDMSKVAGVVGSTTADLTNSAADWARLGYSIKEAGELAKNTAILMNVSEFEDVGTATEALISSLQAFNYNASNSIEIVDKLNIIGNNFAISSDGIAEGLKRSASTLVAAGNSLEQSIAMLAAGNKVVQDPETLGNALKVLSMRIRGTKTELEEAGESTEGMIENTSKLRDKVMALTNVDGNGGVDILADDGSFRATYDILLDIAKIWDQINKADPKNQAALLEILAGKTRGSQLAAILQNPQDLEAAYNMAQNSDGSALKENEKYLNSIQGKLDKLTNASQVFWNHLLDSSTVKTGIDLLREFIELIDKLGIGWTALIGLVAKYSFDKILKAPINSSIISLKDFINTIKGVKVALTSFGSQELMTFLSGKIEQSSIKTITHALDAEITVNKELTKEVAKQILIKNGVAEADVEGALAAMGFAGANAGLATSFKAVGKTALTATKSVLKFLFTNPVGWAILATTAIVGVTSAIKKAKEEAREAAEEAIDTYKEAENTFTSNKSTLDSISDDYQRLSKGVDQFGKNISLTTDEYARYNEITNKIADMFPDMVEGYTKEGNAIIKMKGNVDELTKAYERAAEASRYELLSKGNEIFSTAKDDITNYDNKIGATDAARQLLNGSTIESIMKQYGEKVTSEARKLLEDVGAKSYIGYYASGKQYESYGLEKRYNTQTQQYEDDYTNEEYNTWAAARNKLELEHNQILGEKEAILSKVNTVLQAYIASDSTYSALEEQMQNAVSVIASSLDPKDFNYNDDAMEGFIKNNIIVPIYENQDGIQNALNKLLTIDESSTSYQMYQSLKQALLNAIQNLPEETQIAIKAAFKIGENSEYDIDVNHVKDILQDEFDDKVGEMSIGDLKLAGEIEVEDGALLSWDELNNKLELARATAVKSKADFEQLNGSIDSIQSAYSALRDAVTEYNTNGYLTLDTLQSILTLEPEYLACLQFENGQLVLNQEAMRQMVEQRLNEAEATAIQNAIVQINTLTENANANAAVNVGAASDGAVGGVTNLGYAMSATGSQALEASGKLREFWAAAQNAKSAGVDTSAIQDVVSSLDATINMIHNTRAQLSTSNFGSVMNYKPSSSGSGSSSSSSKEFDFIDVYFKNLENKISENQSKLANLLDDTSAINTKNKLSEEIESYYKQEAASAQKVAEYYTKQAASTLSKIPAKYREAIKNGSLDVATISDDSLNDLLTKYRDYVDKASSYTQKYWDTLEEIANKAKEKFDDIKSDYDNKISFTDLFRNQIQNEIDVAEEAGETISTAYYEALIKNNKEKLKTLKEEQKQLLKILQSGNVRVGTDQYYEMVSALDDVDSAINECEKDTISWTNAINEIKAEQFDKLIDKIKEINDEINNVYDLISDDDKIADEFGNWTKEGITALGLLVQQMQNAEYAADEIGKEIASLNPKDFASYEKYEERLKELNEAQWEEIQASESAKDAIKNLNSARIDSVKNALNKEVDAYEKLINKKKEALQADKDLYDFEKSVAEQQKNIAAIQRKLAALANDSSMEATAKRKKYQSQLAEEYAKRDDIERNKSYNDMQDALDAELKAKQDAKDEEIERLEEYLKDTGKLIQDSLVNVLTNADVILQELNQLSDTYGVSLSDNLKSPWVDAAEQAKVCKENISSDLLELMSEDGILDTFDLNATEYLTSPFILGEEAAKTFKNTVVTQLDGVKTGLKQAYDDAVAYNNNIINACNQAIAAYKKVQQQSTVAAAAIKTQNIPSSSSSSSSGGSSGGGGGGGGGATMHYANTTSWLNGHAFTSQTMTYNGEKYIKDADGYWVYEKLRTARSASNVKRYSYYAKGTKSVKKDQWAFTDEPWLGEEITLHAGPNGNLQYLTKGSGVLAADVTERLMNLANSDLDPTEMLNRSRPVISAPQLTKNEFSIDMNIAEVIHIDHADSDSITDIQKAVQTQMDKYMGKLNNSLRKFTR